MLGAIIGDVVGSTYEVDEVRYLKKNGTGRPYEERIKILDKSTPLFKEGSTYTDDTILTCAILDAIMNGNCDYEKYLKEYGLKELSNGHDKYGRARFGKGFVKWLNDESLGDSFGNGAAMRISPVGYLFDNLKDVQLEAVKATNPTHNSVGGRTAAMAVASAIYLLRTGSDKDEVRNYMYDFYDLEFDLEDLQKNYKFSSISEFSVPQALYIFFESENFEDAIRKAISIGGDSDTIACIVGSLAEAAYGIPEDIKEQVKEYLSSDIINLLNSYYGDKIWKK